MDTTPHQLRCIVQYRLFMMSSWIPTAKRGGTPHSPAREDRDSNIIQPVDCTALFRTFGWAKRGPNAHDAVFECSHSCHCIGRPFIDQKRGIHLSKTHNLFRVIEVFSGTVFSLVKPPPAKCASHAPHPITMENGGMSLR